MLYEWMGMPRFVSPHWSTACGIFVTLIEFSRARQMMTVVSVYQLGGNEILCWWLVRIGWQMGYMIVKRSRICTALPRVSSEIWDGEMPNSWVLCCLVVFYEPCSGKGSGAGLGVWCSFLRLILRMPCLVCSLVAACIPDAAANKCMTNRSSAR